MAPTVRTQNPKVMLIGMFPDLFLEGLQVLDFDFELNVDGVGTKKSADILVVSPEMTDEAFEFVSKFLAVPVLKKGAKGFYDFNPIRETGNAFLYDETSPWHMLDAVIRARETFKFVYDWQVLKSEVKDLVAYTA